MMVLEKLQGRNWDIDLKNLGCASQEVEGEERAAGQSCTHGFHTSILRTPQSLLGGGNRAPSIMQLVVGETGPVSAPLIVQALALTVLFFLKALHRASAVSMAIGDFLLVAFLRVIVSKNLLKLQRFKGSLYFPAWKAVSS